MKTLEEAAKEYSNSEGIYNEHGERLLKMGFVKGANWQKEQSQWHDLIKNPDDLPEIDESVITMTKNGKCIINKINYPVDCYGNQLSCTPEWSGSYNIKTSIIAWMPIPEFKEE